MKGAQTNDSPSASAPSPSGTPPGGGAWPVVPAGLRVLLVDDELMNRRLGERLFRKLGGRFDAAASVAEALDWIAREPFDVVFSDVQLPDAPGGGMAELYRETDRAARPARPQTLMIVALTADALGNDPQAYRAAGFDDFISKPVSPDNLRHLLESWEKRTLNPPPVSGG